MREWSEARSWLNAGDLSCVAANSCTGIATRPKERVPFHRLRGMGDGLSRGEHPLWGRRLQRVCPAPGVGQLPARVPRAWVRWRRPEPRKPARRVPRLRSQEPLAMATVPTTVEFPVELHARRDHKRWIVEIDGRELSLSNLDKPYWRPEGYTKGDLVTYYAAIAPYALPYAQGRPLTMKRMPDGADGEFFYAKQAPDHTPEWVRTAPVVSVDSGKRIDYVVADQPATLVWLANLGCIELHPWHARIDDLSHPDYAFFDLDPMDVGFEVVRDVAVRTSTATSRTTSKPTSMGSRSKKATSGWLRSSMRACHGCSSMQPRLASHTSVAGWSATT